MTNNIAIQNQGWRLEHTYTSLPAIFYRNQNPTTAPTPKMVIFNERLAHDLGLNPEILNAKPEIFSGTKLPHGAKPISQAYAGYQFGYFAMLGDGRAVLLGEQITPQGSRYDIQLKGSGPTHFSRNGDGLAALLPMLREYIISEAMFCLGIPTTRSLAVALTGRDVTREKVLPGAVLTRVASSHIRVGTFNYASAYGTKEDLRALADYSIWRHFSILTNKENAEQNKYVQFLREVAKLQASLIAKWQLVGFIHGVMNTDNMAISGETIDYGPCAFMDIYDPDTVFSSIDAAGRYAYKNQPKIGAWNLSRLAESLLPLIHEDNEEALSLAQREIEYYWDSYNDNWLAGMRAKLGIVTPEPDDINLITGLLDLMARHKLDYTNTFYALANPDKKLFLDTSDFHAWHKKWQDRLSRQMQSQLSTDTMKKANPAVIPRNHRVEEALSAAESGDYSVMNSLLAALNKPYEESETYSLPPALASCNYKTFCGT